MPFVNIKVTGGSEAPTAEQKQELIKGATELLQRVLNKNPATTVVIIADVSTANRDKEDKSVTVRRRRQ